MLPGFIALSALIFAAVVFTRMLRPQGRVEFLLTFTLLFSVLVLLTGFAVSAAGALGSAAWWLGWSLAAALLSLIPPAINRSLREACLPRREARRARSHTRRALRWRLPPFERLVPYLLGGAVVLAVVFNLVVLVTLKPATPDSLQYHLARMAFYLQQGSLRYFDAPYWAMVVHPKVATVFQTFLYVITGRNDSLTQLAQFAAYFVAMLSAYGITRRLGAPREGSLAAALVSGLFTITLMEAVTAQNDLILTAFAGCALYFLLAYFATRQTKPLLLSALAFALALGVKATMLLAVPSLLIAVVPSLRGGKILSVSRGRFALLATLGVAAMLAVIVLPAGYWDNLSRFGHPLGPEPVRKAHTQLETSLPEMVGTGALNMLRYGIDFLALDGMAPSRLVSSVHLGMRALPRRVITAAGIDLEAVRGSRSDFTYMRGYVANENYTFWGILGFALVWPCVWIALLRRRMPREVRAFALAAVVFFVIQAFSSPYDMFRGRYFITGALFAVPPLAFTAFAARHRLARAYVLLIVLLGCLSALCAVTFRDGFSFFIPDPVLTEARTQLTDAQLQEFQPLVQWTREDRESLPALAQFTAIVPEHARVAVDVNQNVPLYWFFGDGLARTLLPVRSFTGERRNLPEADFLLYSDDSPFRQPGDIVLVPGHPFYGALFLRILRPPY